MKIRKRVWCCLFLDQKEKTLTGGIFRGYKEHSTSIMYSTTGLAVGMAIGVPTAVFISVFLIFWYRQKAKYKKDLQEEGNVEYDDVNDLDLDNIIDTPKESHVKNFSTDNLGFTNVDGEMDGFDNPDVVIKHAGYSFRKKSKIMGLRMINNEESNNDLKQSNRRSVKPNGKISKEQSDNNYKVYYESMLPIFDEDDKSSTKANEATDISAPNTPLKNHKLKTGHSSQSSMDLYKLLQEDSSMYPGTRLPSGMLGESPLRFFKQQNQSSTSSLKTQLTKPQYINTTKKTEKIDKESESPQAGNGSYLSPFDTPPTSSKRLNLINSYEDKSTIEDLAFDHIPNHTRNKSVEIYDTTINTDDELKLDDSPIKNILHKRGNSGDSRMILETDNAEENYNQRRKEWLDSYRNV